LAKSRTHKIAMAGIFTAVVFLATYLLRLPAPTGYVNLGDSVILLAVVWMGKPSVIPAAVGSALADLLSYPIYTPATLIIKSAMALAAVAILKITKSHRAGRLIAFLLAELIMVAGYFLYDMLIYGSAGALVNLVGNAGQAVVSIILALLLSNIPNPTSKVQ